MTLAVASSLTAADALLLLLVVLLLLLLPAATASGALQLREMCSMEVLGASRRWMTTVVCGRAACGACGCSIVTTSTQ